jgi:hypothetical protein
VLLDDLCEAHQSLTEKLQELIPMTVLGFSTKSVVAVAQMNEILNEYVLGLKCAATHAPLRCGKPTWAAWTTTPYAVSGASKRAFGKRKRRRCGHLRRLSRR